MAFYSPVTIMFKKESNKYEKNVFLDFISFIIWSNVFKNIYTFVKHLLPPPLFIDFLHKSGQNKAEGGGGGGSGCLTNVMRIFFAIKSSKNILIYIYLVLKRSVSQGTRRIAFREARQLALHCAGYPPVEGSKFGHFTLFV